MRSVEVHRQHNLCGQPGGPSAVRAHPLCRRQVSEVQVLRFDSGRRPALPQPLRGQPLRCRLHLLPRPLPQWELCLHLHQQVPAAHQAVQPRPEVCAAGWPGSLCEPHPWAAGSVMPSCCDSFEPMRFDTLNFASAYSDISHSANDCCSVRTNLSFCTACMLAGCGVRRAQCWRFGTTRCSGQSRHATCKARKESTSCKGGVNHSTAGNAAQRGAEMLTRQMHAAYPAIPLIISEFRGLSRCLQAPAPRGRLPWRPPTFPGARFPGCSGSPEARSRRNGAAWRRPTRRPHPSYRHPRHARGRRRPRSPPPPGARLHCPARCSGSSRAWKSCATRRSRSSLTCLMRQSMTCAPRRRRRQQSRLSCHRHRCQQSRIQQSRLLQPPPRMPGPRSTCGCGRSWSPRSKTCLLPGSSWARRSRASQPHSSSSPPPTCGQRSRRRSSRQRWPRPSVAPTSGSRRRSSGRRRRGRRNRRRRSGRWRQRSRPSVPTRRSSRWRQPRPQWRSRPCGCGSRPWRRSRQRSGSMQRTWRPCEQSTPRIWVQSSTSMLRAISTTACRSHCSKPGWQLHCSSWRRRAWRGVLTSPDSCGSRAGSGGWWRRVLAAVVALRCATPEFPSRLSFRARVFLYKPLFTFDCPCCCMYCAL